MPKKGDQPSSRRVDFYLALVIAVLLIGSLLSQEYFDIPYQVITALIAVFLLLKLFNIVKKQGTSFADYMTLVIILIFGILHAMFKHNLNATILSVMVVVFLYSVGMTPSVKHLTKTHNVSKFIANYVFFVILIIFLFAGAYMMNPSHFTLDDRPTQMTFQNSFYFSTMTFTTVGYGDIAPTRINRTLASFEAILALVLNIAFIGYILSSHKLSLGT
ncbi:hypothetical protein CMI48_03905 [Candidatus Pacearchaeota archaeon]|jgi:hypothetical protein|nr:hypothetical protein [Candidatus Pacearchaeota archaeon]